MRALPCLLLLLPLAAGCKSEPDFEARYAAQANAMSMTAGGIEGELNNQLNAARAAGIHEANQLEPAANGAATQ
jgi:hypothetical protein